MWPFSRRTPPAAAPSPAQRLPAHAVRRIGWLRSTLAALNPFHRAPIRAIASGSRRSESAATDRESWIRDGDAGPQGNGGRGLNDAQRVTAVRKSRYEFDKTAVYGGVLDRFIDFVLGDGIVIKAKDATVDLWLQAQLKRGWYGRERRCVENLFIDGEDLLVVRALDRGAAPIGEVRIGTMDPLDIQDVHVNRFDADDVVGLTVRPEGGGTALPLPVVRQEGLATPLLVPAKDPAKDKAVWALGAFWRVNARGVRGVPVLLRTLDHASSLNDLVAGLVEQLEYVRRIWLHATVNTADDTGADGKPGKFAALAAELKTWATQLEPGAMMVTSGGEAGVKINAIAPDMKMADAKALYDVVLEMCLGGHGIPRMWFGNGGDTNRATAAEQGTPIFRAIQSRQAEVRACVEQLVRAVLTMGEASGVAGVTASAEVDVTMATVATRDSERDVREIAALGATLAIAVERNALTEQEAAMILRDTIKSKTFGAKLVGPVPPKPAPILPAPGALPVGGKPAEKPPLPVREARAAPTEVRLVMAEGALRSEVTVNMPKQEPTPAPVTNVTVSPPPPTEVVVNVPAQPAQAPPVVQVHVQAAAPVRGAVEVVRDAQGRIQGVKPAKGT